jgi:hypothetical protein
MAVAMHLRSVRLSCGSPLWLRLLLHLNLYLYQLYLHLYLYQPRGHPECRA